MDWSTKLLLADNMSHILKFIFLPITLILGAAWATIITFYLAIVFSVFWVLGTQIKVRESGEETGYIRWFKFYPKLDK